MQIHQLTISSDDSFDDSFDDMINALPVVAKSIPNVIAARYAIIAYAAHYMNVPTCDIQLVSSADTYDAAFNDNDRMEYACSLFVRNRDDADYEYAEIDFIVIH